MTAEQGPEGPVVEGRRTEAEIIAEQGYIIAPKLMRVDAVLSDGPRYDSLEPGGGSYGPRLPEMNDRTFLKWMFLGLTPDPLRDPLNPEESRRVGVYIFYDPKRIETTSQYDLENGDYESEAEWEQRRELWKKAGWVPLDRGERKPPSDPASVDFGEWFIRRASTENGLASQGPTLQG